MVQFKVTDIDFDFESDGEYLSLVEQEVIIEGVLNKIWEVEDEEELTDSITDATGFCIRRIYYDPAIRHFT
jgi:hypothetical protein